KRWGLLTGRDGEHDIERFGANLKVQRRDKAEDLAVGGDADVGAPGVDPELGGAEGVEVTVLAEVAQQGAQREAEHAEAAGAVGEIDAEVTAVETHALAE